MPQALREQVLGSRPLGSSFDGTNALKTCPSQPKSSSPSFWHVRHGWHNQQVLYHCDNQVVVACLRVRTSGDEALIHLLRCIEAHGIFKAPCKYLLVPSSALAVRSDFKDRANPLIL
jgi:hypothetical protein